MGPTCTAPSTSADRCVGHSKGPLPHSPVRHKHIASHWATSPTSIQPSIASHWATSPTPIQPSIVSHWALSQQHSFCHALYHTGHSASNTHSAMHCITLGNITNTHSAIHCITLGTQPPTPIQPSTASHWAFSHQQPFRLVRTDSPGRPPGLSHSF